MPKTESLMSDETALTNLPQADNVRVVMVQTTHPGNIGAAARAMKNMGLTQLVLVAPQCFPNAEATARASGAVDILEQARVVETLQEALLDCHYVVGASARLRSLRWPQTQPRGMASEVVSRANASQITALVFGRESSGLTNDELDCCQQLVHIPTNPDYSSLNVAAAIQLLCYEVRMAALALTMSPTETLTIPEYQADAMLASGAELHQFYAHLEQVAVDIGMLNPKNPRYLMRRFRRLFHRVELDKNEVGMLRGWLSATQTAIAKPTQAAETKASQTEKD